MTKRNQRTVLYKCIWDMVRKWQRINNVSESELASYLRITERTLKEYNKSAHHLTLEKLDNLLDMTGIELNDLMQGYNSGRQDFKPKNSYSQEDQFFKWDKNI